MLQQEPHGLQKCGRKPVWKAAPWHEMKVSCEPASRELAAPDPDTLRCQCTKAETDGRFCHAGSTGSRAGMIAQDKQGVVLMC